MQLTTQMVAEAADFLKQQGVQAPKLGFVLGTGLNGLVAEIEVQASIPYRSIPHFPAPTMEFHKGQLVFGQLKGLPVVALQGRFHFYEGYSMAQVTFPIRVLHALGIEQLVLSNAAGGLNPAFNKGDLVLIEDHINLLPDNPLRGLPADFGNRFVDMFAPYHEGLRNQLAAQISALGRETRQGVYVAVMGPNLESRAEYRWLAGMGADMVGMSTVPEVIVANQLGLPCAAISVITDVCDPARLQPVNIEEIIAVAGKADEALTQVFVGLAANMNA